MIRTLPFRVLATLAAGLAFAANAAAQPVPASQRSDGARAEPFVHEVWTVKDGLPANGITRLVQGHDGYLWLGTWDGLVRFDGARFTVFNAGNTEALPSSRIVKLDQAPDGSLWLQTEQHHLVRLRGNEFTHFGTSHGLPDGTVLVVFFDPAGGLWIGTSEGLLRFEGERFVRFAASPPNLAGYAPTRV
jgi:ligand-binding sensor domain-containing protein